MMNKFCASCKSSKQIFDFTKDAQKSDGLSSYCKECSRKKQNEKYAKNHERKNKSRNGLSTQNPAEYSKIWTSENKELASSYYKKYRKNNAPKVRATNMDQYTKRRNRNLDWLNQAHKAEIEGMYFFCQVFKDFQVDHIVPLMGEEVSGLHAPWNLQVITGKENRVKSNFFNPSLYPQQGTCAFME
jgi:bifunctional N-acetylglucosamine-1-phosphate-uridyltransferase/glucosamine-1-phosphate-acetyltransferase GlmU-like protein